LRAPAPLDYTPEVARATASIFERVRRVIPEIEWPVHAPYIAAINALKRERNAIILAHNYQTPEIFHGVADLAGDSLALARQAARTDAEVIVLCGVHFMAETAKLLCPEKTVLIPDLEAGCSLASSITAEDVRLLRHRYPAGVARGTGSTVPTRARRLEERLLHVHALGDRDELAHVRLRHEFEGDQDVLGQLHAR